MKSHSKFAGNFVFVLALIFSTFVEAQQPVQIQVLNSTLAATDSVQPFWFTANQQGKIPQNGSFFNVTNIFIGQNHRQEVNSAFSTTWGINGVAALGSESSFQLNRIFAGVAFKGWELKAGMFYDSIRYAGLSTTNGNLARSGNARPMPSIRFSTLGYKSLPFFKKWFRFKAEYEEKLLNDERYIDAAHLHHKSLYGKFRLSEVMNFTLGLEHFVVWGGTSPVYGDLPGWDNYLYYVLALPGNSDFPDTDKKNISGNQLGTYQLELERRFQNFEATLYVSHPYEDNSGLNWHNRTDNLVGLYVHRFKGKPIISDALYEFTYTKQQSIRNSSDREYDSYFNHGVYRSGFTYYGRVLSSPLFFPVKMIDGVSAGIQSNRFFAHHLGVRGFISEHLQWRGLITYVEHFGTYQQPYQTAQKNVLGMLETNYINPDFPVELGLSVAGDAVNTTGKNLGIQLTIGKSW